MRRSPHFAIAFIVLAGILAIIGVPSGAEGAVSVVGLPIVFGAQAAPTPDVTATPTMPRVVIVAELSQFDAPGNDNDNLVEEYVTLRNDGDDLVAMAGWTLFDVAGNTYTFGDVSLAPAALVSVHTGVGQDTVGHLYWGRSQAVWNNDGDTVYLHDEQGRTIYRLQYD